MFAAMSVRSVIYVVLCVVAMFALALGRLGWAQQGCSSSNLGMDRMEVSRISLLDDRRQRIEIVSFIADDSVERANGYQHICPEVIARTTILFRYDAPSAARFHMHNVKAPLDIGFFDEDGLLIQYMVMHPYGDGDEKLYGPMLPFQYALEARVGFFREKGLSAGAARLLLDTLP